MYASAAAADPLASREAGSRRQVQRFCVANGVYTSAALLQFRCQAKSHLPFLMWYRQTTFGAWASWDQTTATLRRHAASVPWTERRSPAFFRGSLQPPGTTEARCLSWQTWRSARCELLHLSLAHPQLVNYTVRRPAVKLAGPPFAEWAMHKYVVFVEGSEEWADRLKLLLQLGCVVLIQELWCHEHYFWMLEPFVHYVPLSTTLDDLTTKVRWLQAHDEDAQRIAAAGQRFAEQHLSRRSLLAYHGELLRQYAELQTDRKGSASARPSSSAGMHEWPNTDCRGSALALSNWSRTVATRAHFNWPIANGSALPRGTVQDHASHVTLCARRQTSPPQLGSSLGGSQVRQAPAPNAGANHSSSTAHSSSRPRAIITAPSTPLSKPHRPRSIGKMTDDMKQFLRKCLTSRPNSLAACRSALADYVWK